MKPNFIVNQRKVDRDTIASEAILQLLQEEYAVVWPEVEAKLSEVEHPLLSQGINPHLLTNARRRLLNAKIIDEVSAATRGGARINVYGLVKRRRMTSYYDTAAGRKRLLHARYRGWATGTSRGPNMIGAAGERVTQASMQAAAAEVRGAGYLLLRPEAGNINNLLGAPVPSGALDNAAHLTLIDSSGLPVTVTVMVEVKNLRGWLYPGAHEIYQLLEKAVRLQNQHPGRLIIPVLVCRRSHYTTFLMAKDLGFFVVQTKEQPILEHSTVSADAVAEVRNELGYSLLQGEEPLPLIVNAFRDVIPTNARLFAERWASVAEALAPHHDTLAKLRNSQITQTERGIALDIFHTTVKTVAGVVGNWRQVEDAEPEDVADFGEDFLLD